MCYAYFRLKDYYTWAGNVFSIQEDHLQFDGEPFAPHLFHYKWMQKYTGEQRISFLTNTIKSSYCNHAIHISWASKLVGFFAQKIRMVNQDFVSFFEITSLAFFQCASIGFKHMLRAVNAHTWKGAFSSMLSLKLDKLDKFGVVGIRTTCISSGTPCPKIKMKNSGN